MNLVTNNPETQLWQQIDWSKPMAAWGSALFDNFIRFDFDCAYLWLFNRAYFIYQITHGED